MASRAGVFFLGIIVGIIALIAGAILFIKAVEFRWRPPPLHYRSKESRRHGDSREYRGCGKAKKSTRRE